MPRYSFDAIGTQWHIDTDSPLPKDTKRRILARIADFDSVYSRFRADSVVAAVARREGRHTFSPDAPKLFAFYRLLYELTEGKVTPLIGTLLADAGYDAAYSFQPSSTVRPVAVWEKVMWWNGPEVFVHIPVEIDVGAAGKGYLVDIVGHLLQAAGIGVFVIDASGDILHHHNIEECVGLEHPTDPSKIIGVSRLQGRSLCASAINRRVWRGLHHLMDPHTGQPASDVVATWVVADSTMVADGLATALFFTTPDRLKKVFDFEYVRISSSGSIDYSPGFQGELFV